MALFNSRVFPKTSYICFKLVSSSFADCIFPNEISIKMKKFFRLVLSLAISGSWLYGIEKVSNFFEIKTCDIQFIFVDLINILMFY